MSDKEWGEGRCGCRTMHFSDTIIYCPTHAAAFENAERVEALRRAMLDGQRAASDAEGKVEDLLAAARGQVAWYEANEDRLDDVQRYHYRELVAAIARAKGER